MINKVQKLC